VTLNSPVVSEPRRTKEKDPPPYGAQYRQDALWEGEEPHFDTSSRTQPGAGGNEALPPQWRQYKLFDGIMEYQDVTLPLASWNRPLPGVRLGRRTMYH